MTIQQEFGRDEISSHPPPQTPVVLSPHWFYKQPDDGPLTRPKHVVVY